ncbi:hypothetical protein NC652_040458 [Populus alba x Populus x berolinensis]|nr:hypothetical protein NC652_040458 [Populus alba x Populus x berolinensis]
MVCAYKLDMEYRETSILGKATYYCKFVCYVSMGEECVCVREKGREGTFRSAFPEFQHWGASTRFPTQQFASDSFVKILLNPELAGDETIMPLNINNELRVNK